ncbi:iron-sulfur cluster assembly scaffold protein [Mycoplasma phocoeninasale]|uniref:Iron-sulfur cluster assembly scaffold protein n=1 Tax=Mycoplasma phocoeninasale TaxID=2726117 RepID=A0A858U0I6_9MOLU|nr:iron-sulfur cluster assembly scaffold protein [Mycoplasma phocoeninasale]MBN0970924.1 iron-sulfur cluster assembly scaffold protein [Mycoplasma phocoeninasale]QJG66584.1 iron-sulfur cluster assembly scaffold protein [Mycoplasma phocoeninasale]
MSFYSNVEKQKIVFDAYLNPKHKKETIKISDKTIIENSNICVDNLKINLSFKNDILISAEYEAIGCSIFLASIELMIDQLINKHKDEISDIVNVYFDMINNSNLDEVKAAKLDKLAVLENVKKHLNRLECASIIYRAVKRSL